MKYATIIILMILPLVLKCQINTIWEKEFYPTGTNSADKVLFFENTNEIVVFGLRNQDEKLRGLLKLDLNGNEIKNLHFGNYDNRFENIQKIDDSTFILIGFKSDENGNRNMWLQKMDINFNIIQDTIYKDIIIGDFPRPVIKLDKAKNFIIVFNSTDGKDCVKIIKMSPSLNMIWEKTFYNEYINGKTKSRISAEDFTFDENENIIIVGNGSPFNKEERKEFDYDMFIIKTNKNGDLIWRKTFGLNGYQYYAHSVVPYENNYFISGRVIKQIDSFPNDNVDVIFTKITNTGELKFTKNIGGEKGDISSKIISNEDGTFYIIGTTNSTSGKYASNNGKSDNLLLKVDTSGQTLNTNVFGTAGYDSLYDIVPIVNNKYILVGGYNFNKWKIYLTTLNEN